MVHFPWHDHFAIDFAIRGESARRIYDVPIFVKVVLHFLVPLRFGNVILFNLTIKVEYVGGSIDFAWIAATSAKGRTLVHKLLIIQQVIGVSEIVWP